MHVTEVIRVAAQAWNKVKPADDPDFNNCALSFREKLIAQVERVVNTGGASDDFEQAAKEIMDSELKAPEATPESAEAKESKPAKDAAKKSARK